MRWDDPATCQKEELLFAVNEIRLCSREDTVAKHAPLLCIVKIAHLYATDGRTDEGGISDEQKRLSINLIHEACDEARRSGFINSHTFTAAAACSLRALKANKECVQLARSLISQDGKVRHRIAFEEAILAATEERDYDSSQLLTDILGGSDTEARSTSASERILSTS